ncbi:23S rRNA (uracil(1939)-C(5))-methyltransferase RlmD [Eionea flava]
MATSSRKIGARSRKKAPAAHRIPSDKSLLIERLADDGRGIASVNGHAVFVDGALPDEEVTVLITRSSTRYSEGKVKQITKMSEQRITPSCAVFSRCGGCALQYMPVSDQVAFKQATVLSQLSRWSSISPQALLSPISSSPYHYRQRLRLAVDYTKIGDVLFGFREADSRAIVETRHCDVAVPALQVMLPLLRDGLSQIAKSVSHIELIHSQPFLGQDDVGIVVRHTRKLSVADRHLLQSSLRSEHLKAVVWFQSDKGGDLHDINDQAVTPRMAYVLALDDDRLSPLTLQFHPQDFIQSNHAVNQMMIKQALELLAPQSHELVLDLFCGIGNFSLPIAQFVKRVVGIEGIEAMVERATANAQSNQISNVSFAAQDLSKPINARQWANVLVDKSKIDALVLDPPRAGAKTLCENITELSPGRIVYVSCDSSTFARDAGILANQGYCLAKLGVMDMFPQTSHVEIMALFTIDAKRKKSASHCSTTRKTSHKTIKRRLKLG